MMKRLELVLLIAISYLAIGAILYLLIFDNNSFASNRNNYRITQRQNSNREFERLYLLDELDSLKAREVTLSQELILSPSVKRELLLNAELMARKNFEIEEIEYKQRTSNGNDKIFVFGVSFALIIMPILGIIRLWEEVRRAGFQGRVNISSNEIADILTYCFGAVIFILIFL